MKIAPRPPPQLLQRVFQLILVGLSVLFNILKVYQSRAPGKVFLQDGRRNLLMSVTIKSTLMILVSSPSLGKEHIKSIKIMLAYM